MPTVRIALFWLISLLLLFCSQRASAAPLASPPLPIVIWHGLGDRFDSPGLKELADDIKKELGQDIFVHIARAHDDAGQDQKSSLFANMNTQLEAVASRLQDIPELQKGFKAIGLSQGGVYLRGYVERYNLDPSYPHVHSLITLGSPHMGISSAPPCGPTEFFCKAAQLALRAGAWTPYAQSNVVPAQYFRNQASIQDYLEHDSFLRDINNERQNDSQPISGARSSWKRYTSAADHTPRNSSYVHALQSLENFVLFAFTQDKTVIPHTSPHFTLPSLDNPKRPLAWKDLPLYWEDYVGLKGLHEAGRVHRRLCAGQHMQIDDKCWSDVMAWLKPDRGALAAPPLLRFQDNQDWIS